MEPKTPLKPQLREQSIFEDYFIDDWRSGQEIRKVIITQRFYQVSPNSTQV